MEAGPASLAEMVQAGTGALTLTQEAKLQTLTAGGRNNAPNVYDQDFFNSLTLTLLDLSEFHLIVGGDFNAV